MTSSVRNRKSAPSGQARATEPELMAAVLKNWRWIVGVFVALAGGVLFSLLYKEGRGGVINLIDADVKDLKEYLLKRPSILLCGGGTGDNLPAVFTDLQKLIGGEYEFATLNCDNKLPSGKTLWEKYNLNKKMTPVIFGVAPWARPVQASHSNMKTAATLRVLFESKLAAKANIITSTADLIKTCGWSSQRPGDGDGGGDGDRLPPCIAVAKGARFNEDDANVLKLAMKTHTKPRYVSFAAKDRRLSFEDAGSYNPSRFGAKYYALRNDSSFMALTKSPTEDNVMDFVSQALDFSTSKYTRLTTPTALIKFTADRIKDVETDKPRSGKKRKPAKPSRDANVAADSKEEIDPELERSTAKERQRREAEIRERMSEEERNFLFEDGEDDLIDGDGGELSPDGAGQDSQDEDEDVIEL